MLLLLFLLGIVSAFDCSVRQVKNDGNISADFSIMREICSSDMFCKSFYHLDESRYNASVFYHLSFPVYEKLGMDLNNVFESFCSEDSSLLFRKLLLLEMNNIRVSSGLLCGHNEIPVVQKDATVSCVCAADSVCSEPQQDLNALYYVLGVVIFVVTLLLIIRIMDNGKLFFKGHRSLIERTIKKF